MIPNTNQERHGDKSGNTALFRGALKSHTPLLLLYMYVTTSPPIVHQRPKVNEDYSHTAAPGIK